MLLFQPLASAQLSEGITAKSEHSAFFRQYNGVVRTARHLNGLHFQVAQLIDMHRIVLG